MFTWHDVTRRHFCRLVFVTLALGPTCAVLLSAAWMATPHALAFYRRALAEQLAVDVQVDRVSFPLPGVTRYAGLALADSETGDWLARFQCVEVDESAVRTVVSCVAPEINARRMDLFWELAVRRLRLQSNLRRPTELVGREVHLDCGADAQTLGDVRVRFKQGESGPQALVVFHLADQPEDEARMAIFRGRSGASPGMLVQLETGRAVLPGTLLAALLPGWDRLGRSATLSGSLCWQDTPSGYSGQIRGAIGSIDLDALVTDRFDQKLGGTATIALERARVVEGRLVEARGTLLAGPGIISRALVSAAIAHLHTPAVALSDAPGSLLAYEQLGFRFALGERGLSIAGQCPGAAAGTLLLGRTGRPILLEPADELQSPLNLARALAPGDEQPLPVSVAAQELIRRLPVAADQDRTAEIAPAEPPTRR